MRYSQICLRVMLWSLAMSAALGVGVVFVGSHDVLLRLLGTTFGAAAAAGLLWPMTRLTERPESRLAGLVGMAVVLIDFFLVLLLIWGEFLLGLERFFFTESLWLTVLWLFLCGAAAVIFLRLIHHPHGWLATRVGTAATVLVFIELMMASWWHPGRFGLPNDRWFGAAMFTALYGCFAVGSLAGPLHARPWRWLGVAACLGAWALATGHQFHEVHDEMGEIAFTLLTTLAAVVAYTNVMLLPSLSPLHEVVRRATIAVALVTALLVDWIAIREIVAPGTSFSDADGMLHRTAGAAGIITACGSIAVLVLSAIHRSTREKPKAAISWNDIAIACPRCGLEQKVPTGESVCSRCQLKFLIRVG